VSNEEFILQHQHDDVRALALKKAPEGIDVQWCLQQIEGKQIAEKKLPRWAATAGLWFPPRISLEQCSSELTAEYKQHLAEKLLPQKENRSRMIDMTGGFGIDFSYIAQSFKETVYIEQQPHLCEIARHNLPLLGLPEAKVVNGDGTEWDEGADLVFLDPARRDGAGRKTVALEDCKPNLLDLQTYLYEHARVALCKLSPMLDIAQALRQLKQVQEVHVVSVQGECKELLLVQRFDTAGDTTPLTYHCVNLDTDNQPFLCSESERHADIDTAILVKGQKLYLHEPNASILKAGVQDALGSAFKIKKLHPMSHLFVSEDPIPHFPGRSFMIEQWGDFGKQSLKALLKDIKQANLTVRNFPASVAELRKRLKLKEGGSTYLFATTLADGSHALIRCKKA